MMTTPERTPKTKHRTTFAPQGYCQHGADVVGANAQGARRCTSIATVGIWLHGVGISLCADHLTQATETLIGLDHLHQYVEQGGHLITAYPEADHRGDRVWPPLDTEE